MEKDRLSGKLAVILHADVVGSTALVQQDEQLAHERIQDAFRRFSGTIEKYQGRILELRGDALLAEFERASDAVTATLAFQADHTYLISRLKDDLRPTIRVGIAMGEVVIADNTVTGSGVVLAQRVEQLADPGGVCITAALHEALPKRMPFDLENLGEQVLKGFDDPVRVYRVELSTDQSIPAPQQDNQREATPKTPKLIVAIIVIVLVIAGGTAYFKTQVPQEEPASVERMAYPLPSEPSIAVLPFKNLSGDPEQDFLAAGFTEEIITTLSNTPNLFVIAHSSTDSYKDEVAPIKQVAEEQGVRYVLEGSIQRVGNRIRINAKLIDALEGNHLWAERYDRELKDLFALQDNITHNIALAMQVELTDGDMARRRSDGLDPEAFRLAYKADWHMFKLDKENMAKARELLAQAQAISPEALFPLVMQGWVDAYQARFGWSPSREESSQNAEAIARAVLAKDKNNPEGLMLLGTIHFLRKELDEMVQYYQRAVDASPNHANAVGGLGWSLNYAGRPGEAIPALKRAMRLSPYYPGWMDATIGHAYMMTDEYDLAIGAYKDTLAKNTLVLFSHERLAAIYALKGDIENARAHAAKVLEIKPDFSIEAWSKVLNYKKQEDLDRELNALRKAGLPK